MKTVNKILENLFRNMPLVFGVGILTMDVIAISAPFLAHFGGTQIAHWIYTIYGFLCHQRPWRSIHFFDYQVAWCSRDTFIYLGMGLSALAVVFFKIKKVKWWWAFLSILPFATDGLIQMWAEISGTLNGELEFFYASTNFIRMLTGSLFGTGAGLWLFGLLQESIEEELSISAIKISKNQQHKNLLFFVGIITICLVTYLGMVQVWRITSEKYKPQGIIDNVRYFPGVNYEETDRCGHCV